MIVTEDSIEQVKTLVLNILRTKDVIIKFKKADGSIRELHGTLEESRLPESKVSENPKTPNSNIQHIYDLDNNGWRSFRWDSFISIDFA